MSLRYNTYCCFKKENQQDVHLPNPSRETKFSGANVDREKIIFPVQLTTCRIGNLTRLILTLSTCDDHTYIHKNPRTQTRVSNYSIVEVYLPQHDTPVHDFQKAKKGSTTPAARKKYLGATIANESNSIQTSPENRGIYLPTHFHVYILSLYIYMCACVYLLNCT